MCGGRRSEMVTDDRLPELKDVFVKHGVVLAYLFGSQAEGRALPRATLILRRC